MIGFDEDRAKHSLAVAKKMKEEALKMRPDDIQFSRDMFVLGLLHDIGYEFVDNQKSHAFVGGKILCVNGYKYWEDVLYHGRSCLSYDSEALRLLNMADLQIDHEGKPVSVKERLEEVKKRYGEESLTYLHFKKLAEELELI